MPYLEGLEESLRDQGLDTRECPLAGGESVGIRHCFMTCKYKCESFMNHEQIPLACDEYYCSFKAKCSACVYKIALLKRYYRELSKDKHENSIRAFYRKHERLK